MIAVRESLDIKVISVFKDNNGRFIIMYAYVQDKPFLLVNYYAPNDEGGQVQTLSEINNIIDKIGIEINTSIIWGGDFNLYFDTFLDADGGNPKLKINSLSRLISMMEENKLSEFYNESAELNDIMSRWEFLKYHIRQFSSEFSKQKAVERKASRLYLERKVKNLEIQLNSDCSEELLLEYNRSKDELESLYNYITEGIILHSRISWYEHGEKSSKYFLNLEKRNKSKSQIRKSYHQIMIGSILTLKRL